MNRTFYKGILFLAASYLQFLLPPELAKFEALTLFNLLFMLGIIYVCEGIILKLTNRSLFREITKNKKNLLCFIAVSTMGGIALDGIAKWLGKLWVYPYWDFDTYLLVFIPGFAIYWLMIVESYLATKTILDYYRKGRHAIGKPFGFERHLYKFLGIAGLILIALSAVLTIGSFAQSGGYITVSEVHSIAGDFKIDFSHILLMFFGLWFILEFIEHARKKTSLIKDTAHLYLSPLISIIIGSLLLAVIMETQNAPLGYWVYTNWPMEDSLLFGLPILMFFAWPLHYIIFLSLFRACTEKESDGVWQGDLIK